MTEKYKKQKKLQKLLSDCIDSVDAGRIERVKEVHGLKWVMKPLCDYESNWAASKLVQGTIVSAYKSQRSPTLAIGIRAIGSSDGEPEPIEEFFREEWDKLEDSVQKQLDTNEYMKQYFLAEKLYVVLSHRGQDFIDALWDKWTEVTDEQEEINKKLGESLAAKKKTSSLPNTVSNSTQLSMQSPSLVEGPEMAADPSILQGVTDI